MNKHQYIKSLQAIVLVVFTVILAGCADSPGNYLIKRSGVHLKAPVFLVIQDQRPKIERAGDPKGFYQYTVDGAKPEQPAQSLGMTLAEFLEHKGITTQALVASPGEAPPADAVVVHITLLSWYGRLRNLSSVSYLTVGASASPLIYADGHCSFESTVTHSGRNADLGTVEGSSSQIVSKRATISREGCTASTAAAEIAYSEFLRAFEKKVPR